MANYDRSIRIADVKLGKRHRNDLGDLHALTRSIRAIGLLHPIVITPDNRLVAGARRVGRTHRVGNIAKQFYLLGEPTHKPARGDQRLELWVFRPGGAGQFR